MLSTMLNFAQHTLIEITPVGYVELLSVVLVAYYIYAKTRAPAIIAGLFPNLDFNFNYRSPIEKFNGLGNELSESMRSSKTETKNNFAHSLAQGTTNMLQITPHAGKRPYTGFFDWGAYLTHIAQSIRSKKFEYPQVSQHVANDPTLQLTIKQAADQELREQQRSKYNSENLLETFNEDSIDNATTTSAKANANADNETEITYKQILAKQTQRATRILMDMRSTLNNFLLSLTSWLLYKLLPCFLKGVVTHTQQIEMLKLAAEKKPGIPLIFIPLHRSHLDYIMVTFILTNNDVRSPLVAAGNNLQIPIFGGLLRGLGAFFIKRKIDPIVGKKDILYRAILHLYVQHALKLGHNIEFFIEGGRTRTGKPCMPKGGILSIIVNAFMDNSIPDALLVPVSVNYERLVDGNFVCEQKGEKKVPESFGKAIHGIWQALNSNYGLMRIDFNEPYSLRELVQTYNKIGQETNGKIYKPSARTLQHNMSTSSLFGTDVVCEEHRALIDSISRQVVYDCAEATSVMSTNALAFLLLTAFRKGATINQLSKSLDELRNQLYGRKDIGFAGESNQVLSYACDLLGETLVRRSVNERGEVFIQPVPKIESFIELSYYSNTLSPHFALKSILLTTFHSMLSSATTTTQNSNENFKNPEIGVSRRQLVRCALENCDIYRYEFILNKPTQNLENLLESTIDDLVNISCLTSIEDKDETEEEHESRKLSRRLARFIDDEDEDDFDDYYGGDGDGDGDNNNAAYTKMPEIADLFLVPESKCEQKNICEVLAPFAFTYQTVAQTLQMLHKNSMLESEFVSYIIRDLKNKYELGICHYAECISTDSIRNCLKLLEKWSVIEISNQHGLRMLSLSALYDASKDALNTIVQRISAIVPDYKSDFFNV